MDSAPPHLLRLLLLTAHLAAAAPSSAAGVIRLPTEGKGARACAAPADPAVYDRPVIGIVSHPGDGAGGRISNGSATSYIAASYVKFVEAAGARVVPLIYNEPEERMLEKLKLLNGVLFTGGSVKRGPYFETVKKVFQYVLDRNDAGEPFTLFAQCLGFELVSMIVSKDNNILERFDAVDQASILQFPSYSLLEGSVFQRFDPELIKKVSTSCLVMQNHKYGISPKRLRENKALSSFFKILTTSPDENGKVYVSTVEAYKYPITCTQWHPEKAIFEWRKPMIPHSEDAVQVTQHFANHFISQARKSPNRPPADKVLDNLIYNYRSTFSGKTSYLHFVHLLPYVLHTCFRQLRPWFHSPAGNLSKRSTSSPKTEVDDPKSISGSELCCCCTVIVYPTNSILYIILGLHVLLYACHHKGEHFIVWTEYTLH